MLRRSFLPLFWAALAAFPAPSPTAAEADLKAAMLFNFTKFIEWQGARGETKTPVTVAVAGDDGVRDALLELVRGRPAGGRPVQVVRAEQPSDAEASHLIFVGRGVKKRQPEFLALSRRGVVTVGDGQGFAASGGVIGFLVADNKLRFEVNLAPVAQSGVTISSRLLRLATEVKQ